MKRANINTSIESFLVMILMVIFTVSISMIIMQGKLTFERMTENKLQDENARIALSYINKRIKQNDEFGTVMLIEDAVEGLTALRISHTYEEDLYTYIFYSDGVLYENYTDIEPSIKLSTVIVPVENLSFEQNEHQIITKIMYEYHGEMIPVEQVTTLRAIGGDYE